jgi:hypothetical protein
LSSDSAAEVGRERREPVRIDPTKLRSARPWELGVRFAFGAGIALAAGLVGLHFGQRAGGVFLAFPAVLPASLTLLEKKDGRAKADIDAVGAILGSCGMLAFALVVASALRPLGPVVALGLGAAVWVAVSAGLFLAVRAVLNKRAPGRSGRRR